MKSYGIEMQGDLKVQVLPTRPGSLEEGLVVYIQDEEVVSVGSNIGQAADINPISSITHQPGSPTAMEQFDVITVTHDPLDGKEGQAMFGVMEEIGDFYTAMSMGLSGEDFRVSRLTSTTTQFTKIHSGASANVIATVTIN